MTFMTLGKPDGCPLVFLILEMGSWLTEGCPEDLGHPILESPPQ